VLFILCQISLLGGGTWLVQSQQLSIGQLVSAEIILSGIMVSLNKLPTALEGLYDYETSIYKLMKAKGEIHD
jgi:ABC-type bacteriocin/lantibiotic exporter with double-glycine peptidase domain